MRIWHDFYDRRLSVLGLARKYGRTVKQIEAVIRRHISGERGKKGLDRFFVK